VVVSAAATNRAPTQRAQQALSEGRLDFQRCLRCAAAVFPARSLCSRCGSAELVWETSRGRGTIYAATTVHRRDGRHGVCLIDVAEGFRVMSSIVDADPDAVLIGADVRLVASVDDPPRALFRLTGSSDA
jgi:uncharacterized OB-fold protein